MIAGAQNPLAQATHLTWGELQEHTWVLQQHPSPMRAIINQAFHDARVDIPGSIVETTSIMTLLALVQQTDMLGVTPLSVVNDYPGRHLLAVLPIATVMFPAAQVTGGKIALWSLPLALSAGGAPGQLRLAWRAARTLPGARTWLARGESAAGAESGRLRPAAVPRCLARSARLSAGGVAMSSQIELPGATDWVRHAPAFDELESIEAFFSGHAFNPHVMRPMPSVVPWPGCRAFPIAAPRPAACRARPMVFHPDEVHDGRAGAACGFRYRMLYVPPALVQDILGGRPLPFHREGVSLDPRLARATDAVFATLDEHPDALGRDDALYGLVATLAEVCQTWPSRGRVDFAAALRAREYLEDNLDQAVTLDDLARCAGRDRWSLTRDFRAYFGTSPHRYLTLRRLDRVACTCAWGWGWPTRPWRRASTTRVT